MMVSLKNSADFPITCPTCGGGLRQESDRSAATFACHIGHSFSAPELNVAQLHSLDRVLNFALRALNERKGLCKRFALVAAAEGLQKRAEQWDSFSEEIELKVEVLRNVIEFGWDSQNVL